MPHSQPLLLSSPFAGAPPLEPPSHPLWLALSIRILIEWHNQIMEHGYVKLAEAGKEVAWAVGMSVGGGVAGGLIGKGLTRVAEPALRSLAGHTAVARIGVTGKIGENALKQPGGDSPKYFQTTKGARFIDQFVGGVAHESKVGYASLTKAIKRRIANDAELIKMGDIQGAAWHFYTSPVTGKGGASKQLLDELTNAGIKFILH